MSPRGWPATEWKGSTVLALNLLQVCMHIHYGSSIRLQLDLLLSTTT